MQIRPLRLELNRPAEFEDRIVKIVGKIKHAARCAMGLGIAGSQTRGLPRLAERAGQVSFANKRVREVYVCLHKIRLQSERLLKLADGGINLVSREQHPAERIVPLGTLRREPNDFLESGARGIQVSPLKCG